MAEFLKLSEVVERYRVSTTTIYSEIKQGRFPAPRRIGKAARWWRADLDAFDSGLPQGVQYDGRHSGRRKAVA